MDFAAARKHMVDSQVRPNDVTDIELQLAMESLPREKFVPSNRKSLAYAELGIEMFPGRWLLQARDFSKLIHAAGIRKGDLVLDVGCGYGYSSAVIARLAGMVVALEEDESIAGDAEKRISALGIDNAVTVHGPLTDGMTNHGPYDVITIANGGIAERPVTLLEQLKPGGRLVAIWVNGGIGRATVYTKSAEAIGDRFVFEAQPPGILPGFKPAPAFTF